MELLVYSIAFKDWLMIIYSDRNYSLLSYIYIYKIDFKVVIGLLNFFFFTFPLIFYEICLIN